ncbi:hypothetical protein [Virgibacillus oceani]|uniref:3-isopropylmalate dehydratase n=1 Tax=Virgibacillus oceani TaxID=1479511 RepID=A0A917M7Z8_9BACI|nr:hypothetical protein [Virgibacillus oceani]GGG83295.1 hypothetical protein GCM10011398_31120 [Virgibacillus oceani]
MHLIAEQPYFKVERQVNSIEQKDIEHARTLYLYHDKIVTKYREFPIQDVLDITYRSVGDDGGLLYLHTSSGLYTYTVKSSPKKFIEAFKEIGKTE